MITINLDKAKNIQKNRWREARKPLLKTGDTTKQQQIAAKKQALRDVTNTDLSSVTTPEELKNV